MSQSYMPEMAPLVFLDVPGSGCRARTPAARFRGRRRLPQMDPGEARRRRGNPRRIALRRRPSRAVAPQRGQDALAPRPEVLLRGGLPPRLLGRGRPGRAGRLRQPLARDPEGLVRPEHDLGVSRRRAARAQPADRLGARRARDAPRDPRRRARTDRDPPAPRGIGRDVSRDPPSGRRPPAAPLRGRSARPRAPRSGPREQPGARKDLLRLDTVAFACSGTCA